MKDKNKQIDYQTMSIEELTKEANEIIDYLENHENIENETDIYQKLLKLNHFIGKKFQSNAKSISLKTKERILNIPSKKNAN